MTSDECVALWYDCMKKYVEENPEDINSELKWILIEDPYADDIRKAVLEAFSDFVMISYGQYSFEDYVRIFCEYFFDRQLTFYKDFYAIVRISSVFGYFCYKDKGSFETKVFADWLNEKTSALSRKLADFVFPALGAVKNIILYVRPISAYLLNLKPKSHFCPTQENNQEVSLQEEIMVYIDLWFDFISEMREKEWTQ
jgi:hypothetical protein